MTSTKPQVGVLRLLCRLLRSGKAQAGRRHSTEYRLAAVIVAAAVSAALVPPILSSASKETEEALQNAREEAQNTENAIGANEENIDALTNTQNTLQGELNQLNTQLGEVSANLEKLEGEIAEKNAEIQSAMEALEEAENTADAQYEAMKKRLQYMYEHGQSSSIEMFIGSASFAEFLNWSDYLEALSDYDQRMLDRYIESKESVAEHQAKLLSEQTALEDLKDEAKAEQARVNGLVNATSGRISAYASQIADAEAYSDALKEQLDAQNAEVAALEKKLAEERRLEALSRASAWRDISEVTFAEGDRYLLANLIYCEAGNQPYDGQVAVGAVVMNRVMSGAFPDTIVGVIYQYNQFEPVSTGRLALALARDDATPACYAAADAAMAGQTTVSDCIFFRTPIPQINPRYVIGGHIFY